MSADRTRALEGGESRTLLQKSVDRRKALSILLGGAAVGAQALAACAGPIPESEEQKEIKLLAWREYIKGN